MNESAIFSESDDLNTQPDSEAVPENSEKAPDASIDSEAGSQTVRETEELSPLIISDPNQRIKGRLSPQEKPQAVIKVAKRCELGARERNEDSCLVFTSDTGGHFRMLPFGLYIVADGMGGHTNGHVASKIASRVAAHHILTNIYMPLLVNEGPPQVGIRETLVDAVTLANTAVYEDEPEIDSGTTLTVALLLGNRLHIAHVGDSRLYLHTPEKFEAITNDHSLVQRLQDVGQLTAEEATIYRYRNVLLRAVGQGEEVEIDTYMRLLPQAGKLLLCSDGLCGFVADEDIDAILKKEIPLDEMATELYETALAASSNDNITVVLVDFKL